MRFNFEIDGAISPNELCFYCTMNDDSDAMMTLKEYSYDEDENQMASIILDLNNPKYRIVNFRS